MYGFAAFVRNSELYIFGGFDGKVVYKDFWAVKLKDGAMVSQEKGSKGEGERGAELQRP
jgi:hypothetical protein